MSRHFLNRAGTIFFFIGRVFIIKPSSPIVWVEFSEAGFSEYTTTERDFETV